MHTPAHSSHPPPSAYGSSTPVNPSSSFFGSPNATMFSSILTGSPSIITATATPTSSSPLSLFGSNFGSGLFPASVVVPHFPTYAANLSNVGLSRSAQLLVELSLTFHGAGLAAAVAGKNKTFIPYKPNVLEVNIMPPPGQWGMGTQGEKESG